MINFFVVLGRAHLGLVVGTLLLALATNLLTEVATGKSTMSLDDIVDYVCATVLVTLAGGLIMYVDTNLAALRDLAKASSSRKDFKQRVEEEFDQFAWLFCAAIILLLGTFCGIILWL